MPGATTIGFELTARQRRRSLRGLIGLAVIVWSLGLVRFAVTDRLSRPGGWVALAGLAVLLGLVVLALRAVRPVVVVAGDALELRWGPRHRRLLGRDVTEIGIRERGTARRVVVAHRGGRTVLPVPLTGGSLLGPGPDPELEHKVDLIRGWWQSVDRT